MNTGGVSLISQDVRTKILKLYNMGILKENIGRRFDLSKTTIERICREEREKQK